MTAVGFESTPLRTGAWSQRLRPLGQTVEAITDPYPPPTHFAGNFTPGADSQIVRCFFPAVGAVCGGGFFIFASDLRMQLPCMQSLNPAGVRFREGKDSPANFKLGNKGGLTKGGFVVGFQIWEKGSANLFFQTVSYRCSSSFFWGQTEDNIVFPPQPYLI